MHPEIGQILVERRIRETRPSSVSFLSVLFLIFGFLGLLSSAIIALHGPREGWIVAIPVALSQGWAALEIAVALGLRAARGWAKVLTLIQFGFATLIDAAMVLGSSLAPVFDSGVEGWIYGVVGFLVLLSVHGGLFLLMLARPVQHWFREATRLRGLSTQEQEQIMTDELLVKIPATFALVLAISTVAAAAEPTFKREAIFPPEQKHNHASCVVELTGGDLLTAWYTGTGERDADDVKIVGARMDKATGHWTVPFLLADTPGYPDCNPALFAAPDKTLWLFWPTILDHRWEGALLKFAMTDTPPDGKGPAVWKREGVLHITPTGFDKAMSAALGTLNGTQLTLAHSYFEKLEERSKDELYQRLGWMPRVHPTVLPSGRWLLPLYSDTFSASIIAISDDHGTTWSASKPIIGFGNIQPSIVRKDDGTLVAYMRENGPRKRIRVSSSKDEGVTWSEVTDSSLANPGAGIEAIRLANGHWIMIYNDTVKGRHSLAVSLSEDEGATWTITRHVANGLVGDEQFHYPSIIQAADGLIHTTFTSSGKAKGSTIDHAVFNEEWVREGDEKAR